MLHAEERGQRSGKITRGMRMSHRCGSCIALWGNMGLLSSSVSVSCYRVDGELEKPFLETVYNGLSRHSIKEIDGDQQEKIAGWTSFENPYVPDFEGSSFVVGTYLLFSMRVDRKIIPAKVVKKHCTIETEKRLRKSGREHLSKGEKRALKEHVTHALSLRIPATPHVYDIAWSIEESWLWFFSNLKTANETLETLFKESFNLSLIRLFPYTAAYFGSGLTDGDRDRLLKLTPTQFSG